VFYLPRTGVVTVLFSFAVLESWLDYTGELEPPEPLARLPQLKHCIKQLITDLGKVQQIALCCSTWDWKLWEAVAERKVGASDVNSSVCFGEISMLVACDADWLQGLVRKCCSKNSKKVILSHRYFGFIRQLKRYGRGHTVVFRGWVLVDKLYLNFHSLQVTHWNGRLFHN